MSSLFESEEASLEQRQDYLCSMLALDDDFADVDYCRIEVKYDDKSVPTWPSWI
jgi:hypothetical protein